MEKERKAKVAKYNKEYKEKHKEEIKLYMKKYREDNKAELCEYNKRHCKQYYLENKESLLEKGKLYYEENKEHILSKAKQYQEFNKESINIQKHAYSLKHYIDDKETISARNSEWKKANRDKCNITQHKRRKMFKTTASTLSISQWENVKRIFENKCAYCGKEIFLTMEHFVPNNKGGEYTLNNIIPACKSCNCSKQDFDFFEWYPTQKCYSKAREDKILKHLNYTNNVQQLKII